MTVYIVVAVVIGMIAGHFLIPDTWISSSDFIIDIGLCILLFFVGLDIGKQKTAFQELKELGAGIIFLPVLIAMGSIFGGVVAGLIIGIPINESGAVSAGFGWWTLSAVILAGHSSELSAMAFMSNVLRELIAIITIPFISKYVGDLESIAPSGATAMDTTLPIISNCTNSRTAVVAFISGVILSTFVPILVPFLIGLG